MLERENVLLSLQRQCHMISAMHCEREGYIL